MGLKYNGSMVSPCTCELELIGNRLIAFVTQLHKRRSITIQFGFDLHFTGYMCT